MKHKQRINKWSVEDHRIGQHPINMNMNDCRLREMFYLYTLAKVCVHSFMLSIKTWSFFENSFGQTEIKKSIMEHPSELLVRDLATLLTKRCEQFAPSLGRNRFQNYSMNAPKTLVATTGVPQARDSVSTFAHPSLALDRQKTSAALYHRVSLSLGTCPINDTLSVKSNSLISLSSSCLFIPFPIIQN